MIVTSPSPSFVLQKAFMALLCLGFSLWGAYDLWVTIPHREHVAQRYDALAGQLAQMEKTRQQQAQAGQQATPAEIDAYTAASAELKAISPGGKTPVRPSKFDRLVQWIYIACAPFFIVAALALWRVSRQRYQLDGVHGTLQFQGDREHATGAWPASQIADIDMSRWMAKSIAWAVKSDGTRLKLDAYTHRHLDRIIGALANARHPDKWDLDAKPVKVADDSAAAGDFPSGRDAGESENLAESGAPNANP